MTKKIVVIGGGTGTFVALTGLKKHGCELSAIVTMADSGGSTGILRDEYGVLPPGDVRQCLVALSESDQLMRELFNYRFEDGCLKGHAFGNIFLTALAKVTGSFEKAIDAASKVLAVNGRVIPVTADNAHLVAVLENGQTIKGEASIDEPEHDGSLRIERVFLEPEANASSSAVEAISNADLIVIGPGDIHTSIVPNLLVKGIPEAIKKSRAKKAFVCNLMTKWGQTNGLSAQQHVELIEKYLGRGVLDFVVINSAKIPEQALKKYAEKHKAFPVEGDVKSVKIINADLLSEKTFEQKKSDLQNRSIIRHDPDKLADNLMRLIK